MDPLAGKYPWYTPYQFSGNKVIQAVELEGLEEYMTNDGVSLGQVGDDTSIRVMTDVKSGSNQAKMFSAEINVINELSSSSAGTTDAGKRLYDNLKEDLNSNSKQFVKPYFSCTINNPKTPSGAYVKLSADIGVGLHSREGQTLFGIGEKLEFGAYVEIGKIELLANLDEAYLNIEYLNSTKVNVVLGGHYEYVGGKVIVQYDLSKQHYDRTVTNLDLGPFFMSIDSRGNNQRPFGFSIYSKQGTLLTVKGISVLSWNVEASIENMGVPDISGYGIPKSGKAVDGYRINYNRMRVMQKINIYDRIKENLKNQ